MIGAATEGEHRVWIRGWVSCADSNGIQGEEGELTSAVKSGDAATDECVGLFTPDKNGDTADGAGCVPVH